MKQFGSKASRLKFLFLFVVIFFILTAAFFYLSKGWMREKKLIGQTVEIEAQPVAEEQAIKEDKKTIEEEVIKEGPEAPASKPVAEPPAVEEKEPEEAPAEDFSGYGQPTALFDVPFTPQAPFGEWSDPRQQDGCEEASVLMAMSWVKKETLTPETAKKEILAMAEYELENYGTYCDTSAEDTVKRLVNGYFDYQNAEVREITEIEEIKKELLSGNVVIVPVDGRKLNNPYFTPPGPERHNLLIIGYKPTTKEFITNDSGTKRGAKYLYPERTVEGALRDYPTGDHLPIEEIKKMMIVVRPE